MGTAERKDDHIKICLGEDVGFRTKTAGFEGFDFIHCALPELSIDEIDTSCELFGRRLGIPLIISAMTGGTEEGGRINRDLAWAAAETGAGFMLGSQRAMVENPRTAATFAVDRGAGLLVFGNLGVMQAAELGCDGVDALADAAGASAFCLHLNAAMEMLQPEGTRSFKGAAAAIARLCSGCATPIVVKETGCGISRSVGIALREAGALHVDVAGAGGTSFTRIERIRSGDFAPGPFDEWGIPTADSLAMTADLGFRTLIASGGLRSGLDAAKAIAMGADAAGFAMPVLKAWAQGGREGAAAFIRRTAGELRSAMLLTGSRDLAALSEAPLRRVSPHRRGGEDA